jgi:hypothetical protein
MSGSLPAVGREGTLDSDGLELEGFSIGKDGLWILENLVRGRYVK